MKPSRYLRAGLSSGAAALFLGLFFILAPPARAESNAYAETLAEEYQLKAAFLYNFAKFVTWSPRTDQEIGSVFVIGIFGEDPFGSDIDELLANKMVNDKRIEVRRYHTLEDIEPCHILFINPAEVHRLDAIMAHLKGISVLTVSESSAFRQKGGMINLVMENKKVRFEINKQATDRTGLQLSSQLLKLAKTVES